MRQLPNFPPMKKMLTLFALFAALQAGAQVKPQQLHAHARYYTGGGEPGTFVPTEIADEAEYAEDSLRNSDGTVTVTMKRIQGGDIVRREQYRGKTPVGHWLQHYEPTSPRLETVYDVSADGSLASCATPYLYELGESALSFGSGAGAFTPPQLEGGTELSQFINNNLRYPAAARERGMYGTVRIKGTLTETGELSELAISQSVDRDLDAEVFRVARTIRFKGPALVDGRPARLCVSLPITFSLGQ